MNFEGLQEDGSYLLVDEFEVPPDAKKTVGAYLGTAIAKKRGRLVRPARFETPAAREGERRIREALRGAFTKLRPKVAATVRHELARLHKAYNEDQPRDESGRWGSGGSLKVGDGKVGTVEGWKQLFGEPVPKEESGFSYHATFADRLNSIARDGLQPGKGENFPGFSGGDKVSLAPSVKDAVYWSSMATWQRYSSQNGISSRPVLLRTQTPSDAKQVRSDELRSGSIAPSKIEVWRGGSWKPLTSEKFSKAAGSKDDDDPEWVLAGEIAERLDLSELSYIVDEVGSAQEIVSSAAGRDTLGGIGIDDGAIVDQLDTAAAEWARDRSAELVGMRYDEDGNLVEAARASMRIDESTRDMVRESIYEGLVEGKTSAEIADDIHDGAAETDYPFSEERASLIANTEIRRAHNEGSLMGIRAANEAGAEVKKQWITSGHETVCDDCQDNADAGAIDEDEEFPSGDDAAPAHPNCNCDIVAFVVDDGSEKEGDMEDSEKLDLKLDLAKANVDLLSKARELATANRALAAAKEALAKVEGDLAKAEAALAAEAARRSEVEYELSTLKASSSRDGNLATAMAGQAKAISDAVGAISETAAVMAKIAERPIEIVRRESDIKMTLKRNGDGSYDVVRKEKATA